MRKGSAFVLFVLVLAALVAGAPAVRAQVPILALDGRGFGHGVGLSQWGAKYAADAGAPVEQILATFYPGTELHQQGGAVRVAVLQAPSGVAQLTFPQGGEIHSPRSGAQHPGFPVVVPAGGTVDVAFDGSTYQVRGAGVVAQSAGRPVETEVASPRQACVPLLGPCPTQPPPGGGGGGGGGGEEPCGILGCTPSTQPPPPTEPPTTSPPATSPPPTAPPGTEPPPTQPPAGGGTVASPESVWAVPAGGGVVSVPARGRIYRGSIQAVGSQGLRLVNELDVETYLKGMGEVPSSWPSAAQQAQAIAARTYALRAMSVSGELCDSDRCQVYVGAGKESPGQSAAVDASAGRVLTYGGALATAVYSADAGGFSANTFEGFGTPDGLYPYLTNIRYDTPDPLPWHVDIALSDLAARFGYAGTLTGVRITQQGPSGRALEVTLDGTAGSVAIEGRRFASRLGLRSTLFTGAIGTASIAPPPPPDPGTGVVEQALPDDAAALAAAVAAPTVPDTSGPSGPGLAAQWLERMAALAPTPPPAGSGSGPPGAALLAVGLLGVATALAMARAGGVEQLLAVVGRAPAWRRVHR